MFKFMFFPVLLISVCVLGGCSPEKPPLAPTQVVNGKSIVIPPEFDVIPTDDSVQQ